MAKIVHKLSQLIEAPYLDKTGFHSGHGSRLLVLRARRGDPEYIKIANECLARGLLDENLLHT